MASSVGCLIKRKSCPSALWSCLCMELGNKLQKAVCVCVVGGLFQRNKDWNSVKTSMSIQRRYKMREKKSSLKLRTVGRLSAA